MRYRGLTILLLSIIFVGEYNAQDIHLSQFYASDHLLNPSKMGDFEGDFRITGNYRNQWKQINPPVNKGITTSIISFDKTFRLRSQEVNAGILIAHDEFGGINFSTNKILLSGAYAFELGSHNLRAGVQTGLVFRNSDLAAQTFPVQWDYPTGSFNTSTPNQESALSPSLNYFDFNIGVQWSKLIGKMQPKIGLALNHLNRPRDSYFANDYFSESKERLRIRNVLHGEIDYYYSAKLTMQPKFLCMWTAKANDFIVGSNFRYKTGNKVLPAIFGGVFYRNGIETNRDAVYPVIGVNYLNNFDLGFSYDVNISTLSQNVDRKGTFEVSIIYIAPNINSKRLTVPCERY